MVTPAGYALFSTIPFLTVPIAASGSVAASPGRVVVISLYKRGYSGASVELYGSDDPYDLDLGDDEMGGVKVNKATISFLPKAGRHLKDFYVEDDRDIFVFIVPESGPAIDTFYGWLSPFNAREDYRQVGAVSVDATDGLGSLTDFSWLTYPTDQPSPGVHTLHEYVVNLLKWLGYELPIHYNDHLVEEVSWNPPIAPAIVPQHPGPDADPYQIHKVDAAEWYTDEGTYDSCKMVLDDLGDARYLRIHQQEGVWKITHLPDLPGRPDFNGGTDTIVRYYNTYAPGSSTRVPLLDYPGTTVYKDQMVKPLVGSETGVREAIRRYKLTYNYGKLPNQINNGGFIGTPGTVPRGWTLVHTVGPDAGPHNSGITDAGNGVIVGTGTEDDPYFVKILGIKNGDPKRTFANEYRNLYVLTEPLYYPMQAGQQRKVSLSGMYRNIRTKGAAMEVIATLGYTDTAGVFHEMPLQNNITKIAGNSFQLQADGSWSAKTQSNTVLYLHFDNIEIDPAGPVNGKTMYLAKGTSAGGESFSLDSQAIPNIPFPGTSVPGFIDPNSAYASTVRVSVTLFPGPDFDARDHTGCYTLYRNISLTQQDGQYVEIDKEIITTQVEGVAITKRLKTQELTVKLGDQTTAYAAKPRAIRPGAFLRADGKTATRRWLTFYGGHVDKIQNQVARAHLIQTQRPRETYSGTLLGDITPLEVLVFPELAGKRYQILTYKRNVRLRQTEVEALELPGALDLLIAPGVKGSYTTIDGGFHDMDGVTAPPGVLSAPIVPSTKITGLAKDVQDLTVQAKTPVITPVFTPLDFVAAPAPGETRIDAYFETV